MDREAEARAIVAEAARTRKRPSRGLWIVALGLAVVCIGGLAIAWIRDGDTVPVKRLERHDTSGSSSLGLGLLLGLGLGIAVSVFLIRRKPNP